VGLQLAQCGADTGRALLEAGGQALDVHGVPARTDWMWQPRPIASSDSSGCWARWLPTTVKLAVCRTLSWTTPERGGLSARAGSARRGALRSWVSIRKRGLKLPRWPGPRGEC
jgi:hypothetical protein